MSSRFVSSITNKKVIFVSTKNIDYIRNTQEIELIKQHSHSTKIIAYATKNYFLRILKVYSQLLPLLIKNNYDVLFLGFSPQLLFFLFPFISRKKIVIMDFFISVYDTLVDDRKKVGETSLFAKVFHWLDKKTIHKASLVIADTNAHAAYFSSEFNYPRKHIETLYITADVSIYHQNQSNTNHPHHNDFEVIYFGSILPVQGLEIILESMQQLAAEPDIKFTIIGPIGKKYHVNKEDFPNTTFIEWVSQEELAKYIATADLALAGHFSATIGKANRTIAGKTYIYKAMNKPVILGDSEANRELFEEDGQWNYYVERGNPTALATLIKTIFFTYSK